MIVVATAPPDQSPQPLLPLLHRCDMTMLIKRSVMGNGIAEFANAATSEITKLKQNDVDTEKGRTLDHEKGCPELSSGPRK